LTTRKNNNIRTSQLARINDLFNDQSIVHVNDGNGGG
jgi:hypothetical protein